MRPWLKFGILIVSLDAAAEPDGGMDAGTAYTLAKDYDCPSAPLPVEMGDAGWLYPPSRVERVNCMLAGAQAELDNRRDAGSPSGIAPTFFYIAAGFVMGLYVKQRLDHHLPLVP